MITIVVLVYINYIVIQLNNQYTHTETEILIGAFLVAVKRIILSFQKSNQLFSCFCTGKQKSLNMWTRAFTNMIMWALIEVEIDKKLAQLDILSACES